MSYTFELVPDTTGSYFDLTYGNNSIYGLQHNKIIKVNGTTAVTINQSYTSLCAIAVSSTNIYLGQNISGTGICIYKLDLSGNLISSLSTVAPQSMTLNDDGSILYFSNSTKLYSVNTSTFNTATQLANFTASATTMPSIRFYQNKLYILNNNQYAEVFDLSGNIKTTVLNDNTTSFDGGTVTSNGDWYFSRKNSINTSIGHFLYQIKLGTPLGVSTTTVDTTPGLNDTETPLTTFFLIF